MVLKHIDAHQMDGLGLRTIQTSMVLKRTRYNISQHLGLRTIQTSMVLKPVNNLSSN